MPRCNLFSVKTDSKTMGITSSAEFLWCSFCSGQRDKSCSHHFVLNLASQTSVSIEFVPDCSWIVHFLSLWTPCLVMFTSVCSKCGITNILGYVKCAHFIHDSITLTSSEFDVSSDGPLS
ncbi:hypothetical protein T12_11576 [Trichinella patagoniensis]|uniref:Uncharacterized protein n=1 Tax=Trichinella patagoniensis TaxID=990121 RepID=A0A0V0Z1V8_9BILA|nr:hypothetical protein T12_11576 [Trichinella patagoniensis]